MSSSIADARWDISRLALTYTSGTFVFFRDDSFVIRPMPSSTFSLKTSMQF